MDQNTKLIITALVVILGGNAGNIVGITNPVNYRPDPFTGLDGAKLDAKLTAEYQELRIEVLKLKFKECKP